MSSSARSVWATDIWRDRRYWLCVAAALVFWTALYAAAPPELNLAWPSKHVLLFANLALLYPVAEEFVFRGALQSVLQRYLPSPSFGPISPANLATSLLFVALHFLTHAPLWAAAVIIPSLAFGYFKERYGSLIPSIVLHVFYNTGYYWVFGNPG